MSSGSVLKLYCARKGFDSIRRVVSSFGLTSWLTRWRSTMVPGPSLSRAASDTRAAARTAAAGSTGKQAMGPGLYSGRWRHAAAPIDPRGPACRPGRMASQQT